MERTSADAPIRRILVAGATGYIGGLLIPRLLDAGYEVRCLARDPDKLATRSWADQVQIVKGDVLALESLPPAFADVDALFYLVHSMGGPDPDFRRKDLQAASNTALVAHEQELRRIIYLGGLGEPGDLSEHLASRQEVGRVLAERGVAVTEFRAAVIVGSGSISFKMVRYLAHRLPVMITPRWVSTRTQPIAEEDVLRYLVSAPAVPESTGLILEIGGRDILTYGDMIKIYGRIQGMRRVLIPVPVLTPRLSSYWVDLVTPIPSSIAHPLIEGMKTEVIVHDGTARRLFPFRPMGYEEAVRRVLAGEGARPPA